MELRVLIWRRFYELTGCYARRNSVRRNSSQDSGSSGPVRCGEWGMNIPTIVDCERDQAGVTSRSIERLAAAHAPRFVGLPRG